MKLAVTLALALTGCSSCTPALAPAPTDQQVYGELVEGGCMMADPEGGLAAVAAEHAGPNPLWLNCLYQPGSTVAGCAVPCSK